MGDEEVTLEGEVGTPYASAETPEGGGFDFIVFGLIVAVVVLVAIQNVWLRRKAERENTEGSD